MKTHGLWELLRANVYDAMRFKSGININKAGNFKLTELMLRVFLDVGSQASQGRKRRDEKENLKASIEIRLTLTFVLGRDSCVI